MCVCVCVRKRGYYAPWMLPHALNSCLQAQVVHAGFQISSTFTVPFRTRGSAAECEIRLIQWRSGEQEQEAAPPLLSYTRGLEDKNGRLKVKGGAVRSVNPF